jgi:hypothetical protein
MKLCLCLLLSLSAVLQHAIAATDLDSGTQHVALVELFTSEGCSSCPPAEAWLSKLADSGRLWHEIVPVAFHVDYWDNLGWKDRFASRENTARQKSYSDTWGASSVYTPGFAVDGEEWKGWFAGQALPSVAQDHSGRLRVTLDGVTASIDFVSTLKAAEVHVAPLAMKAVSEVRSGENRGRALTHDFVALTVLSKRLESAGQHLRAALVLPPVHAQAVAIWVTSPGSLKPLQATGGFLSAEN